MYHKQCSLLGKLSLHGGTVIASCLYLASRIRSNCTIPQGCFSHSQGWKLSSPHLAGVEACPTQHNCSSLHLLVQGPHPPRCFKLPPTSQQHLLPRYPQVQSCPFLIHLQRSEWSSLESGPDHVISVFVTHLVFPVVLWVKSQLHPSWLPTPRSTEQATPGMRWQCWTWLMGRWGSSQYSFSFYICSKSSKRKESFLEVAGFLAETWVWGLLGQRVWRRPCGLREQHLQSPKGYTETLYVFIPLADPAVMVCTIPAFSDSSTWLSSFIWFRGCCAMLSCSVMSNPLRPHGLKSSRLLCPGKNAWVAVGCCALLQGIFPTQGMNSHCRQMLLRTEPPGKPKHTGVGSLSLLQRIFPTQVLNQGFLDHRHILYQLSQQGSPVHRVSTLYLDACYKDRRFSWETSGCWGPQRARVAGMWHGNSGSCMWRRNGLGVLRWVFDGYLMTEWTSVRMGEEMYMTWRDLKSKFSG